MRTGQCHLKYEARYHPISRGGDGYIDKWNSVSANGFAEPLVVVTPTASINKPVEDLPGGNRST